MKIITFEHTIWWYCKYCKQRHFDEYNKNTWKRSWLDHHNGPTRQEDKTTRSPSSTVTDLWWNIAETEVSWLHFNYNSLSGATKEHQSLTFVQKCLNDQIKRCKNTLDSPLSTVIIIPVSEISIKITPKWVKSSTD